MPRPCPAGTAAAPTIGWSSTTKPPSTRRSRCAKTSSPTPPHELRTPLTIINGYTENLLDGAIEDPEMAKRFLSVMKKHGDRIARIIEDMLTISRLESGGVESLKLEEFSMAECAADVIERLHLVAEERGAKIKRDFPKDSMITGDRFYWDQIMFNLIENALKQNRQPGLTVSVSMRWDGAYFELSVGDDGIGIPGADLPYIFKRFYRVEKHHSTQEIKGTGLGLSIVKRAIEAHGGTINVSSSPGKETRFTIRAPREPKREEMLPLEEKVS
ncbi:MAG: HAMP domain-containing sensor histidine kinase [Verrucomicrobiales bacterium]